MATRPDAEQLGALEGTADLLRSLGHEVVERDFPLGPVFGNVPRALPARRPRRGGARCRTRSGSRAGRAATCGWAA